MTPMELETYSSTGLGTNSLDLSHSPTSRSTRSELRDSRHTTINPIQVGPSAALPKPQKIRGWIQLAALCWSLFLIGWSDACTGPLLPRMREVYHVGHRDH